MFFPFLAQSSKSVFVPQCMYCYHPTYHVPTSERGGTRFLGEAAGRRSGMGSFSFARPLRAFRSSRQRLLSILLDPVPTTSHPPPPSRNRARPNNQPAALPHQTSLLVALTRFGSLTESLSHKPSMWYRLCSIRNLPAPPSLLTISAFINPGLPSPSLPATMARTRGQLTAQERRIALAPRRQGACVLERSGTFPNP